VDLRFRLGSELPEQREKVLVGGGSHGGPAYRPLPAQQGERIVGPSRRGREPMGEKGNTADVLERLRAMAAEEQDPSVRDRVMQMLEDYETLTGILPAGTGDDEDEERP